MKKLTTMILATRVVLGNISCKKDTIGEGPITTEKDPILENEKIGPVENEELFDHLFIK